MSETVNQETQAAQAAQSTPAGQQTTQGAEKTFTQADVDRIVAERLQRDRAKYADYDDIKSKAEKFDAMEEASKTELQKATDRANKLQAELDKRKKEDGVRVIREKVAKETKVPVSLLTGETEEACTEQAKAILAFAKPDGYPQVPDGGEAQGGHTNQFGLWGSALEQMRSK